jgi:hypothetical protein
MARNNREAFLIAGAAATAARMARRGWSARIVGRLSSTALRKGMHGGSRGWLYVAAGAQAVKLLQTVAGRKEEVFTLKLRPGDAFEIRHYRRAEKK